VGYKTLQLVRFYTYLLFTPVEGVISVAGSAAIDIGHSNAISGGVVFGLNAEIITQVLGGIIRIDGCNEVVFLVVAVDGFATKGVDNGGAIAIGIVFVLGEIPFTVIF